MAARRGRDRVKVLAVASGGGHWVQLRRLRAAWEGCETVYVTTLAGYEAEVAATEPGARVLTVPDANRWQKLRLLRQFLGLAAIVLRERPDAVVSTGASPGYFALRLGRLFGARTVWVDSIANAAELSRAGRLAGPHADLWLTQWPELAREGGPHHRGAVL